MSSAAAARISARSAAPNAAPISRRTCGLVSSAPSKIR
jgi:hypothetical protein